MDFAGVTRQRRDHIVWHALNNVHGSRIQALGERNETFDKRFDCSLEFELAQDSRGEMFDAGLATFELLHRLAQDPGVPDLDRIQR